MTDLIDREVVLEKLSQTRPSPGEDGSKDRYRYLQWLADNEAIQEVPLASCQQVTGKLDLVDRRNAIDALEVWVEQNKGASLGGCLFHWRKFEKFLDDLPSVQPDVPDTNVVELVNESGGLVKGLVNGDCISRQAAIDALRGYLVGKRCPNDGTLTCRLIENEVINKLPPAQPETHEERTEMHECDLIDREAAVDAIYHHLPSVSRTRARTMLHEVPSAQPEVIRCKDCIYYDPPHVENNGVRYEYDEMPADAFDALGTGLVNAEYGINIGGRCCVDYYCKNYSDDKRVFVREDNYCGRAERRTDDSISD